MSTDELDDVILEGRTLVPEDPRQWIIPQGMIEADSALDWWESLMKADAVLDPAVVHACQGAIAAYDTQPAWWQMKIVGHVKVMLRAGLTMQQVCEVTEVPIYDILGPALVKAWNDLQDGVPIDELLPTLSKVNQRHAKSFHLILTGKARTPSLKARRPEIKHYALERTAAGIDRRTICAEIWERFGEQVKPDAISQWIHRDRQQRAKQAS